MLSSGSQGMVAQAEHARLRRMRDKAVLAEGPLRVHQDHLRVGTHRLDFGDLWSVSVDVGSQVLLRCASDSPRGVVHRLEVPGESALKWGSVLQGWQGRAGS